MSGHDETFLPPGEGEANHPPTPAPPNFGQSSAGKPAVVFQSADTQPGSPVFSGPSMASDAEETMTPPLPKRPGAPTPDAQSTPPSPPAGNPAPGEGGSSTDLPPPPGPRHAAPSPSWSAAPQGRPESEVPEAEQTVANPYLPEAEQTVAGFGSAADTVFSPFGSAGTSPYPGSYGGSAEELPEAERTATDAPPPAFPGSYGTSPFDAANGTSGPGTFPAGTTNGTPGFGTPPPYGTAEAPGTSGAPPFGVPSPHTPEALAPFVPPSEDASGVDSESPRGDAPAFGSGTPPFGSESLRDEAASGPGTSSFGTTGRRDETSAAGSGTPPFGTPSAHDGASGSGTSPFGAAGSGTPPFGTPNSRGEASGTPPFGSEGPRPAGSRDDTSAPGSGTPPFGSGSLRDEAATSGFGTSSFGAAGSRDEASGSGVPPFGGASAQDGPGSGSGTSASGGFAASKPSSGFTDPAGKASGLADSGSTGSAGTTAGFADSTGVTGSTGAAGGFTGSGATGSTGSTGAAGGFADLGTERTAASDVTSPTSVPPPGVPAPEGEEQKVTFEDANGQRTLAIARFGAGTASSAPGPALTPDAILPPGTPPQAPPEPPPPDPGATATGPIPRLGAGPGFPGGPSRPPRGGGHGGSSGAHRALLVAGGLVAALILGGGGALAVTQLSGGSAKEHNVAQSQPPPPPTQAAPTPTPTKTKAKHKPKPKHVPVDIRDEKKDPKPLTITEVFPTSVVTLAKAKFTRVKTVINDHCSLAANGPFATELTREHCRRIVRATFVSEDKKIAVTAGIAVMPTDAAARATLKVQDPAHYEWFRGMKATGAPKIDHAGGYAADVLRGRYIAYAYATYVDGHKPKAKDDTLKKAGIAFRDYTVRPITRRAKQH